MLEGVLLPSPPQPHSRSSTRAGLITSKFVLIALLLLHDTLITITSAQEDDTNIDITGQDQDYCLAIDKTFSLQSAAQGASGHPGASRGIKAMLLRHGLPRSAAQLRNSSDAALLKMAMLAAVGSMSTWQRGSDGRIVLDESGSMMQENHFTAVESDVMLCIVCTLLAIIVMFHIIVVVPAPSSSAAASNTNAKSG